MRRSRSQRIHRENTLKSIYHVLEQNQFHAEGVTIEELAQRRRETLEESRTRAGALANHGLATLNTGTETIYLTPEGLQRALSIVRNHRLWELYLTHAAQISAQWTRRSSPEIDRSASSHARQSSAQAAQVTT